MCAHNRKVAERIIRRLARRRAPESLVLDNIIDLAVCIASLLLAGACLGWLQAFPSVFLGDAWAYHTYALKFRENGFLSDFGSIRPYGYPAFLYLVSFLGLRHIPLYAGLTQYFMFLGFSLWLARQVRLRNRNLSFAILVGLLLNPFIISIVVDSFSEGLLIPIFILLTCLAIKAGTAHSVAGLVGPLGLGALAA